MRRSPAALGELDRTLQVPGGHARIVVPVAFSELAAAR
jgi:hypothetical protein